MTKKEAKKELLAVADHAEQRLIHVYELAESDIDAASSVSDILEKIQRIKHYIVTGL